LGTNLEKYKSKTVPIREIRTRELLNDIVSFLPSGRVLELQCGPPRLDVIPSDLGRPISGEYQMGGVPAEGTLTLKSVKKVFGTRRCTMIMTYLFLGICAYLYYL